MAEDVALETAREVLDGTVCECGHLEGEHVMGEPPNECQADDLGGCACDQFSPVRFVVVRRNNR